MPAVAPPCSGPIPRRALLQAGVLAFGGASGWMGLPQVLAERAAAGESKLDTAVILLYLHGGPSQLETYDLKPKAPIEYRSLFAPIPTNVPGIDICELFPLQAKIADKFSLVRSLHHEVGIHSDGGIVVLTGKVPTVLDPTSGSKSEHPDFGSIASKVRGLNTHAIPPYVAMPSQPYMTRPTYLGLHHSAFEVRDPSSTNYRPPQFALAGGRDLKSLGDRRQLLKQFDRFRSTADDHRRFQATDEFRELAFELLTSPQAASAFDVTREVPKLRDRYGRHEWGQSCLLARRLAEAGTAVITVSLNSPISGPDYTNWDDHIMNAGRPGHFAAYMGRRLPYLDQALSALIEDIFARSLERRIMVVVMGEFGRTPRLSSNANGTGRDHWPQAYSALVSGGNLRMGQVVGATNSKAEFPTERPCTPQDLLATIYRHLGIESQQAFPDLAGRPIHILSSGQPIAELV